jgi:sugar lactone lactonase YvrE
MAVRRRLLAGVVAFAAVILLGLAALTHPEVRNLGKSSLGSLNIPAIRRVDTWFFNLRRPIKTRRELGDGGRAADIVLNDPMGLAQDSLGNVYIGDRGGGGLATAPSHGRVVWRVNRNGRARIIAGTGRRGVAATGGSALESSLGSPESVCVDNLGRVYVADAFNHVVVRIESDGRLTRVAGSGRPGATGDGGPATQATLNQPYDVSLGRSGDLYIADFGNNRIRKVTAEGLIQTVAGTGEAGYDGDGGPATRARLNGPYGVFAGSDGGFLIGDSFNNVVRKVDSGGTIHTLAGNGRAGYAGDGGPALKAMLDAPQAIYIHPTGRIYIGDEHNHVIRIVDANGVISRLAGTGLAGFSPDGTPAAEARLNDPENFVIRADRSILFTEAGNHRVRLIDSKGRLHTFAGGR